MARPKKCRRVARLPRVLYFKPRGIPLRELEEVSLPVEGVEALRLVDAQGMDQETAALRMGVSRHTLGRILAQARKAVAQAISGGLAICIEGGNFELTTAGAAGTQQTRLKPKAVPERRSQKGKPMIKKIAISSEGPTLDDQVDPRFGRAAGFVIVDLETMETRYLDNGASQTMAHGAGLQAAENVAAARVQAVLSDYVGPKAMAALGAVGIQVGQNCGNMTVRQALEKFLNNEITLEDSPKAAGSPCR